MEKYSVSRLGSFEKELRGKGHQSEDVTFFGIITGQLASSASARQQDKF
jgi:hypothetical protein